MASPARDARLAAEARGFTEIFARGRGHLVMRNPATGKFSLDTQAGGGGWHYGAEWANEVDSAWEADTGAWQWKMVKAEYNLHARSVLNAGDILQYDDPASVQNCTFQPLALNWVDNVTDSRQQITQPQAVTAVATGDQLYWADGYGAGRHFRYTADSAKLIKHLIIDSAANLPAPTVNNPYLEIEFIIKKSAGVTLYVDGVAWDNSTKKATANAIEYRLANGTPVWALQAPGATDAAGNYQAGIFQLRRQGASRYCTVRIPKTWLDTAVFPISLDPTIDVQVGATADDAYWYDIANVFSNSSHGFGNRDQTTWGYKNAFFRFTGITIPAGATITSGTPGTDGTYMTHRAIGTNTNALGAVMCAIDADNPAAPTTRAGAEGATRTTATVNWTIPSWTSGNDYYSPDLAPIIQELLDSYTISNDAMVLYVEPNSGANGVYRDNTDYSDSASLCAKLHIEYTEAGGSPVTVNLAAAALAASGQALDVQPGAVSKSLAAASVVASGPQASISAPAAGVQVNLTAAALSSVGQLLDVVPGAFSLALDQAIISMLGQQLDVQPGLVSLILDAAALLAAGQQLDVQPGAVSRSLASALLSLAGQLLDVQPGAATLSLDAANVAAIGQIITISAPSGLVVALDAALLSTIGQALDIQPGAVTLLLDAAQVLAQGQVITISAPAGGTQIDLGAAVLAVAGQILDIQPGDVNVALDSGLITALGLAIAMSAGGAEITGLFRAMSRQLPRRMIDL